MQFSQHAPKTLFNANSAIFRLVYHVENKLIFNEMMIRSALCYTNMLSWILQCQLTETPVRRQTCRPTGTHYPDSEPTSLCSFSLMLCAQQRNNKYQFIVFGLTDLGLRPTIYSTRDEHTNHYTTDAVERGYFYLNFIHVCK